MPGLFVPSSRYANSTLPAVIVRVDTLFQLTCGVCDVRIFLSRGNVVTVFTLTGAFHVSDTTTLPFARPAST